MEQSPSWETVSQSKNSAPFNGTWRFIAMFMSPLLVPVLSQMNPTHIIPTYFFKMHSIIILPYMPRSSKWYLLFRFPDQNFVCISYFSYACCMPLLSHPPWFEHSNNIWWRVQVMKLSTVHPSSASCHFLSLMFKHSHKPVHTCMSNLWLNVCFRELNGSDSFLMVMNLGSMKRTVDLSIYKTIKGVLTVYAMSTHSNAEL